LLGGGLIAVLSGATSADGLGKDAASVPPYDPAPAAYADLLGRYVVRLPVEGSEAFETRFDYAAFHEASDRDEIRGTLRRYFFSARPESLRSEARAAWAINAYNFFVIDRIMEDFLNADGDTLTSIRDAGEGGFSVFEKPWIHVAGRTYSLNEFEKHFLFQDVDREGSVPATLDPRFHFAVVCAARGCPPLWPVPFRAGTLDEQLDAATTNALGTPAHLVVRPDGLHVSKIFEWYAADFGPSGGIPAFLANHDPEVKAPPAAGAVVADIPWDWGLNRP